MVEKSNNQEDEFRYRLINEMNARGLTASDLSRLSGVTRSAISLYTTGKNTPKTDKIYALASALNVNPVWLMGFDAPKAMPQVEKVQEQAPKHDPELEEQPSGYYIDTKTLAVAQELKQNKELALLFDAARDASPEDLQTVHTMLMALKRKDSKE